MLPQGDLPRAAPKHPEPVLLIRYNTNRQVNSEGVYWFPAARTSAIKFARFFPGS